MNIDDPGLIHKIAGGFAGALLSILFIEPKSRREGWRRFIGSAIAGPVASAFILHQTEWPPTSEFVLLASCISAFLSFPVMKTGYRLAQAWMEKRVE